MAKKIINYKAKISRALSNMIRLDSDIIMKFPNENAVTSNLFKRIGKKKDHLIEMEYDKYIINASIMGALITKKPPTKPKPDIISHYKFRDSNHIVTVAEAKFFNRKGIIRDYYKIWAYKIAFNIEQGQLIIFPERDSPNVIYEKSQKIYNISQLESLLVKLDGSKSYVIDIIFNNGELERIIKMIPYSGLYKNANNDYLVSINSKNYMVNFDGFIEVDNVSKQHGNIIIAEGEKLVLEKEFLTPVLESRWYEKYCCKSTYYGHKHKLVDRIFASLYGL